MNTRFSGLGNVQGTEQFVDKTLSSLDRSGVRHQIILKGNGREREQNAALFITDEDVVGFLKKEYNVEIPEYVESSKFTIDLTHEHFSRAVGGMGLDKLNQWADSLMQTLGASRFDKASGNLIYSIHEKMVAFFNRKAGTGN